VLAGYPHPSIVAKYTRLCPQFQFDEQQLKYYIKVVIRGLLKKMVEHKRQPSLEEYEQLKADLDKSPSALEGLDELSSIGLGLIKDNRGKIERPADLEPFVGVLDHVARVLDLKSRLTGEHPEARALLAGVGTGGGLLGGGTLIQALGGVVVIPRPKEVEELERARIEEMQRGGREPELVKRGLESDIVDVQSSPVAADPPKPPA
jgi:hypothetical protein